MPAAAVASSTGPSPTSRDRVQPASAQPFVASPTPEYVDLANQGVGLLATTPPEWKRQILKILRDDELREEQILNGRIWTKLNSYSVRSKEFWSAWTD